MKALCLLGWSLLPSLTSQYLVKCDDAGDRRPNVSINPRVYSSLTAICEMGAGCSCSTTGSFNCHGGPAHSVHMIFTAFQDYCVDHCQCSAESSDMKKEEEVDSWETRFASIRKSTAWKENQDPNQVSHKCSGTCSEVARACSWAYTGECMCTASSTPDPWGLFASHGCVAVIALSQLGGRDLGKRNVSDSDALAAVTNSSSSKITPAERMNSIVKGSQGFYNASTGAQVACPCNSTCVSYGCCGSNGMTYQPADRCLGKLDTVND